MNMNTRYINNNYIGFHTVKDNLTQFKCPLQIFVGPPYSFESAPYLNINLSNRIIFIHSKYVGNIAKHSSTVTTRNLKIELMFLEKIKVRNCGSVFHLTSYHDDTPEKSILYICSVLNKFCKKLNTILDNNYFNHVIVETSNNVNHLASKTEHLKLLYDNLDDNAKKRVKFCIDTSHIFVTYYDISTATGMIKYLAKFDALIGLDKINLIHLNDSNGIPLSSHRPHAEIGKGNIFKDYETDISSLHILKAFANIYVIPCILERNVVLNIDKSILDEMEIYLKLDVSKITLDIFMSLLNKHKIIFILSKISDLYSIFNNIKSKAYTNASISIAEHDIIKLNYKKQNGSIIIDESKENIIQKYKNIKNVGNSIAQTIYELIYFNKVKKIEELENNESYTYIKNLVSIFNIGLPKSKRLLDLNIKNVDDILKYKKTIISEKILTEKNINTLKYINDIPLLQRDFIIEFKKLIKFGKEWHILGSYARGQTISKDIDILIFDADIKEMIQEIIKIYKLIIIIRTGELSFSGIFESDNCKFIIDINKVEEDNRYTAIMHFTGSKSFNIFMRNIAKEKNMKLNQYGLYKNGKKLKINSEEDIFNYLDLKYVPPNKRNI
jgi:DNA polymerase/3'-5' exonuclease PolX/endonuclease IV